MILTLSTAISLVKAGLSTWAQFKASISGGAAQVAHDAGADMTADELEPHLVAAEQAQRAAGVHAGDRINQRHGG